MDRGLALHSSTLCIQSFVSTSSSVWLWFTMSLHPAFVSRYYQDVSDRHCLDPSRPAVSSTFAVTHQIPLSVQTTSQGNAVGTGSGPGIVPTLSDRYVIVSLFELSIFQDVTSLWSSTGTSWSLMDMYSTLRPTRPRIPRRTHTAYWCPYSLQASAYVWNSTQTQVSMRTFNSEESSTDCQQQYGVPMH